MLGDNDYPPALKIASAQTFSISFRGTALMKSYSVEELAFLNRGLDDFSKLLD